VRHETFFGTYSVVSIAESVSAKAINVYKLKSNALCVKL